MKYIITDYKVNVLPVVGVPNARYYVPNGNGTDLDHYVTDRAGAFRKVKNKFSLTTLGNSGKATYDRDTGVLNIPNYAPDLSNLVPFGRNLTINGVTQDLSEDREWVIDIPNNVTWNTLPGKPNGGAFIFNGTDKQTGNFNISGNGTIGGILTLTSLAGEATPVYVDATGKLYRGAASSSTWADIGGKPNGGDYIYNQFAVNQGGNFRITGTGTFVRGTGGVAWSAQAADASTTYFYSSFNNHAGSPKMYLGYNQQSDNGFLQMTGNGSFGIYTQNGSKALFHGLWDGKVGVGTISPVYCLDIHGTLDVMRVKQTAAASSYSVFSVETSSGIIPFAVNGNGVISMYSASYVSLQKIFNTGEERGQILMNASSVGSTNGLINLSGGIGSYPIVVIKNTGVVNLPLLELRDNTNTNIFQIKTDKQIYAASLNDTTGIKKMVITTNGVLSYEAVPTFSASSLPNSGNYIFNQYASAQTADFWIKGSAQIDRQLLIKGDNLTGNDEVINFNTSTYFLRRKAGNNMLELGGSSGVRMYHFVSGTETFAAGVIAGNFQIGSSTSAGDFKLQVSGLSYFTGQVNILRSGGGTLPAAFLSGGQDLRIFGSTGSTVSPVGLTIQNQSTTAGAFSAITFYNSDASNSASITYNNTSVQLVVTGANGSGEALRLQPSWSGSVSVYSPILTTNIMTFAANGLLATAFGELRLNRTLTVTSGTNHYYALNIMPVWNQTGSTGNLYGIYYNPTTTNISGAHFAMSMLKGISHFANEVYIGSPTAIIANNDYKLQVSGHIITTQNIYAPQTATIYTGNITARNSSGALSLVQGSDNTWISFTSAATSTQISTGGFAQIRYMEGITLALNATSNAFMSRVSGTINRADTAGHWYYHSVQSIFNTGTGAGNIYGYHYDPIINNTGTGTHYAFWIGNGKSYFGDLNNSNDGVDYMVGVNNGIIKRMSIPVGGGSTTNPAGSNTQIQYNNSGAFGASAGFTWNDSTKRLQVVGDNYTYDTRTIGSFGGQLDYTLGTFNINNATATSTGSVVAASIKRMDYNITGSSDFNVFNSVVTSANFNWLRLLTDTPRNITVVSSGVGVRAVSANAVQVHIPYTGVSSTISHVAGMQIFSVYQTTNGGITSGVTINNYYGLLLGDISENMANPAAITNKWAIYQSGTNDKSYFAGKLELNNQLQLNSLSGTSIRKAKINEQGIVIAQSLNSTYIPSASSDSTGSLGDETFDGTYHYIKTASGWVRAAYTTF